LRHTDRADRAPAPVRTDTAPLEGGENGGLLKSGCWLRWEDVLEEKEEGEKSREVFDGHGSSVFSGVNVGVLGEVIHKRHLCKNFVTIQPL